jgi:hypothetical protein
VSLTRRPSSSGRKLSERLQDLGSRFLEIFFFDSDQIILF